MTQTFRGSAMCEHSSVSLCCHVMSIKCGGGKNCRYNIRAILVEIDSIFFFKYLKIPTKQMQLTYIETDLRPRSCRIPTLSCLSTVQACEIAGSVTRADGVSFLCTSIMTRKMYDRRSQESVSLFVCLSPGEDGWPFTLRASGNSHNAAVTRGAYHHSSPSHQLSFETSRLAQAGFWSWDRV